MQFLLTFLLSTLLASSYSQWTGDVSLGVGNKGPDLKLSIGRNVGKVNVKGWGSTDFAGGWKVGISAGIKFKRSIDEVSGKYSIYILANKCDFNVYDENADGIITLEDMTRIFEDKTLGRNLFNDLHVLKYNPGISKSEFYERIPHVIKDCAAYE